MSLRPPCRVIPVLDLLGGVVVRAVRGERGHYQPMRSQLAPGSDPLVLARALLDHPACQGGAAPALYVADLDAIQGRGLQTAALRHLLHSLRAERPGVRLWLDGGFADARASASAVLSLCDGLAAPGQAVRPVHGSESVQSLAALAELGADPEAVLSLDSRQQQALDPAGCWEQPSLWPATLIVMTLDRVGAGQGPDLGTFDRLRALAGGRAMVGAGGIRSTADLVAGRAAGAEAWLVASALHDGLLDR